MHANNSGNYIRVGQMVVAVAYVQWSAIDTTAAGDVVITGLPFAAANVPNNLPTAAVTAQTIAYPAGQTQILARFRGPNGTAISPLFSGSGIAQAFVQVSQLSAAGIMSFTIVYRTN
jgi:2-methylaconitate cis-trans-isomerase PrpF